MYDAINKGFRVARGEILAEMDTDDMYLPWSVAIAVQALKKHPLIFGDWLSVDPEGRKANMQVVVPFISSFYRATGIIAQPTVFWRRDVTDKIGGFDQHFKLLGDVEYWLRADVAGFTFHKINEVLAIVRNCSNSQSLSPHNRALLRRELEEIRDKYSNAVARVLWRLVHPVPFVRRAYLIRYWLGFSNTWPMFRCSKALPTRMRTLLSLMWLGSSRINLLIDWSKLLPTGVVL
jgi:GT2 family glycosyltransferase